MFQHNSMHSLIVACEYFPLLSIRERVFKWSPEKTCDLKCLAQRNGSMKAKV